ncbi:MAG: F-type +-transporting ATPase subunit a [Candidatus Adlerbacteria bacterium]|nr:F-type +-transporting ATPase subunit a [Candidatus Adlerbacteria bacterium]
MAITRMKEGGLHISLAAERVGTLFGLPITNTLLAAWFVMIVLSLTAFFVGRNPKVIPGKVQNFFEMLLDFVLGFIEQTLGSRALAIKYLPLLVTIFLFIFASNLFDFLPFFGSVGIYHGEEFIPFLHAVNTDLNVTLALAIIAVISIEVAGVVALGAWTYAGKFFNFSSPLNFFVGIIEFVSEMSRFISFSFRLFGNIFAGQVLLSVIALFVPYGLPVPMMAFELFVGFVQAAVFAMLTLFFIKIAITAPHGHGSEVAHAPAH